MQNTRTAVTEEVSTKNNELEVPNSLLIRSGLDELYDFMKNDEGKALLEKQIAELDAFVRSFTNV